MTIAASEKTKLSYEFGGPIGTFLLMASSHFLVYYLWISLTYYQGGLFFPHGLADILPFLKRIATHIAMGAAPTLSAAVLYLGFILLQFLFASTLPGVWVKGLPVASENNRRYDYLCNALASWYATLILAVVLHLSGLLALTVWANQLGPLITVSVIAADLISLALYLIPLLLKTHGQISYNPVYDYFMGTMLNPRIGKVDIKMFSDIRASWMLLFLVTLSAAAKQYQEIGSVSWPMLFIIVAQGLYANACMKGEECVPTTWDIFQEKCGWMFVFWNFTMIPFAYSFQAFYILKNNPQYPFIFTLLLFIALFAAYYVWDTANSQKNRFRMQQRGTYVPRHTFPQLPWGTLKEPRYLKTAKGDLLLIDGWYAYARKIHYTADIIMATTWGLCCGFSGLLPYLYPAFFIVMIVHRYFRDDRRCAKKYQEDWERYQKAVPYIFIPYIY